MIQGIIFVSILASAMLHGQISKVDEIAPDTLITLQRGSCESRCAAYRLTIFADGTVIYDGQAFVHRMGLIKSGITRATFAKLISDLEAGDFFALENNYGYGNDVHCVSTVTDRPTAILSFSHKGRSKTILHHHSCIGPGPNRLTELEDDVDRAVGTAKWIK